MRQTDGHDEANRLFSRLCERSCKQLFSQQNSPGGFCNEVAVHFPRGVTQMLKNNPDEFQGSEGQLTLTDNNKAFSCQ